METEWHGEMIVAWKMAVTMVLIYQEGGSMLET
jgi:hypothetical protein